jgi:hypothetical protein
MIGLLDGNSDCALSLEDRLTAPLQDLAAALTS